MSRTGVFYSRSIIICIVEECFSMALVHVPTGSVSFSSAHFGTGVGPIFLDDVGCTGSENKLTDCPSNFFVSCNNGHSEDAGVRCQGSFT